MSSIPFTPIGVIHSPFSDPAGMPIQPSGAGGREGFIDIDPSFSDGLSDLEGFERIILLYVFHQCQGYSLRVTPYLDTTERGLFSTRAPRRPNPIGLSVVRIASIKENRISIVDVDILDGTPLLDIKPYIPGFDAYPSSRAGWLEERQHSVRECSADIRFHESQ